MYQKVKLLLTDDNYRHAISVNAYHKITDLWCAEVAAEHLIKLLDAIVNKKELNIFEKGPCSKAEIIKNNWYSNAGRE